MHLNGTTIDLAPYWAQLAEGLTRQELAALFEELTALAARVRARLELGATEGGNDHPDGEGAADCLLATKDAAARLAVTPDWLYRHANKLPFTVRLGPAQLRFSSNGIAHYIRARQGK